MGATVCAGACAVSLCAMRMGHIELFVRDPLASKAFYVGVLGFDLVHVQDGRFVWVKLGEREILLRQGTPPVPAASYQQAAAGIVLFVDDVEAAAERLRERGLEFRGTDGSELCLTFMDPDGNWFQLAGQG